MRILSLTVIAVCSFGAFYAVQSLAAAKGTAGDTVWDKALKFSAYQHGGKADLVSTCIQQNNTCSSVISYIGEHEFLYQMIRVTNLKGRLIGILNCQFDKAKTTKSCRDLTNNADFVWYKRSDGSWSRDQQYLEVDRDQSAQSGAKDLCVKGFELLENDYLNNFTKQAVLEKMRNAGCLGK